MKTNLIQTVVATLTLAAAGYAQTAKALQVNVPFDFVVGNRTLAAGVYTVVQPVSTSALVIRSAGSGAPGVVILADRVESRDSRHLGKLVFTRYGDRYFLSQAWDTDRDTGSQLQKTVQERELAKNSRGVPATVFIAAR